MIQLDSNSSLTTVDNPYDPIEQFELWDEFDRTHGYNTLAYVARIVVGFNNEESNRDIANDYLAAISEILQYDFLGLYKIYDGKTKKS